MIAFASRAVSVLMIAALASFASTSVRAQANAHVQTLHPLDTDGVAGEDPEDTPHIEFGQDVAIRNGLAFIGMPVAMTTGRVAVFTQGGTGSWVRTATITASDMTSGDEFGGAVSYRDNLLIVGSNRAAYVYRQINGVWREQQKIVPPAADGVALLCCDLKHEAGVLAIGTVGNETTRDSVHVYEQDAAGKFVRRARLTVPTVAMRNQFGRSISMTRSMIVVGARGAAYILGRDRTGTWVRRQELVAVTADPTADDFGFAVAVDRGMILVGAPGIFFFSEQGEPIGQGEVHGFLPGATQYVEAFRLRSLVAPERVWAFGSTIAMFGDRIAVGRHDNTFDAEVEPVGFVETFSRDGSSVLSLGSTNLRDFRRFRFPRSLAIANNLLLVGSPIDTRCRVRGVGCVGEANLFNLNRFGQ